MKDSEDPTEYRPISITSALPKVFGKVTQKKIVAFVENSKRLPSSTTNTSLHATDEIPSGIDKHGVVAAAF